jgi:hypothetical protein
MPMCALCHKSKELMNSHIIPEFMYTHLYDEKHRFSVLTTASSGRNRIEQSGLREKLLCGPCELKFSKLEDYASLVFKKDVPGVAIRSEGSVVSVTGIDYKKFKLFLLSILWRASVSTKKFFENVDLGPHQGQLQKMLIEERPGDYDEYACFIWRLHNGPDEAAGLMMQPTKGRAYGIPIYNFILLGFRITFFVSSKKLDKKKVSMSYKKTGDFYFRLCQRTNYQACMHSYRIARALEKKNRNNAIIES